MDNVNKTFTSEFKFRRNFILLFGILLLIVVSGPLVGIYLLHLAKLALLQNNSEALMNYLSDLAIQKWSVITIASLGVISISYILRKKINAFLQQLKDSTGQLEVVLEEAVLPIITIDQIGTIMTFNKSAEKFFGYTKEEIMGRNITTIQPPEVASKHDQYLKDYTTTGRKTIIGTGREVVAKHKNGHALPIYLSVSEAKLSKDGKSLYVGMITDLTALKQNEQKLDAIIDAAVDAIITINVKGVVQSYNRGAEKLFGYTAEEMIGNNIKMIQPPETASKHDQYLSNYLRTGNANIIGFGRELVAQHKNGTPVPIHLSVSEVKLSESEEPLFVGIARDISGANLKRGVSEYSGLIEKIANGDLRTRIETKKYDGDLATLGSYLNDMTDNLAKIARQTIYASHNIVSGLKEVNGAIGTQASNAAEQEAAVKETTAVMEQIKNTSAETLEKAQVLGKSAERTHEEGQRGLEAVEQSVASMSTIKDKMTGIAQSIVNLSNRMKQIGETTSLVNALAQQSKLLALNASIEAAKAGEAGKGFAVVASEVKDLAEQSHQATVKVQSILDDIQQATDKAVMVTEEGSKEVDTGVMLIEKTGEVINNLNNVIEETTVASQQIVAAVEQETKGVDEVSKAMNEINKSIGYLISSVEQTKNISKELESVVEKLQDNVNFYKLEDLSIVGNEASGS